MGEENGASVRPTEPDPSLDQTTPKATRVLPRGVIPSRPDSPRGGHRAAGQTALHINSYTPYPRESTSRTRVRDRSLSSNNFNPAQPEPEFIDTDPVGAHHTPTSTPAADSIALSISTLVAEWVTARDRDQLPPNLAEILGGSGTMLAYLLREAGTQTEDRMDQWMDKEPLTEASPILNRLASMCESMIENRKTDNIRLARIEQELRIGTTASAPTPNWAADTYATRATTVLTANLKTLKPTTTKVTKQPTKLLSKHERDRPSRFVVHFGETVEEQKRADPYTIVKDANAWISLCADEEVCKTRIATAKWNAHGNLVLTVLQGQSAKTLEPFFSNLHTCYTLTNVTPQKTTLDEKWNKLVIDGVPTGVKWRFASGFGTKPFTSEELQDELMLYNPILNNVRIAAAPRFLIPPADLATKAESSITLAIFDKDIADEILAERYLNLFGKACRVREYQDRTPAKPQCQKCKRFGHVGEQCKLGQRCGMCGGAHTEAAHTLQCLECRADPQYANAEFSEGSLKEGTIPSCSHNLCCVICKEKDLPFNHRADNRQCPERTRQMGSVRDNNRAPDTGKVNGTQPRRKRKKVAKVPQKDILQLGVVSKNSFAALDSDASGSVSDTDADDNMGIDNRD